MRRLLALPVVVLALVPSSFSCQPAPAQSRAARVQNRAELIGGPRALGEIGDWLIENDKVRFVIQDQGFSRGFGVFGGALLDADLVRPEEGRGDSTGGHGKDNFGEMFPSFFLEALAPTNIPTDPATCAKDPNCDPTTDELPAIEVEHAGGDGQPAVLLVRAVGDDFLAITQNLNETALTDKRINPVFNFETRYILEPGKQYLTIDTTIKNVSSSDVHLPQELAGIKIPTPFGDVLLFGGGNNVFTPNQAGFDMRFHLEDIYAHGGVGLPAFPGLVEEFVASASPDVSYGLFTFPPDACADPTGATCPQNFALANKAAFDACGICGPEVTDHTAHVPFIASAFTGVFQVKPPDTIPAGGSFHVKRAFIVGRGDVADISNQVYGILGDKTGHLEGRLKEAQRPLFVEGAMVFVEDQQGNKITEMTTHTGGLFDANLRPGHYDFVVTVPGQAPVKAGSVDITAGKTTFTELTVDSPAEIVVTVMEDNVGPVPAKVTLVGTYPFQPGFDDSHPYRGAHPLFDLSVNESWRYTDLIKDTEDPSTRRYIEAFGSSADGVVHLRAKPGTYSVVVSRGIEYDRAEIPNVTLKPGETVPLTAVLHRVVDTTGYVSADFHLHSQYSLDSGSKVEDRITQFAAEGLEYAVSTDHNFIVDYQPVIAKLGIEKFINSAIGIELTTIDRGHFQGYPLDRQPGSLTSSDAVAPGQVDTIASRTFGSFEWALRTPQQVFDDLRKLGRKLDGKTPSKMIVQVNHPRDSILGYFDQYGVDPDNLVPAGIVNPLLKPDDHVAAPGSTTDHNGRHPEFNPGNFSFDFDAIEVFNGKRYDLLHSARVPQVDASLCGDTATLDAPCLRINGAVKVVDPASCCEVTPGDFVLEPSKMQCADPNVKNCSCDATQFQYQIDNNTCDPGKVAFPGAAEDWMNLLLARPPGFVDANGKKYEPVVGTANSDSHEPDEEEPATPRTYVGVGKDEPLNVTPDDILAAFHKGDVLMTNGPFVRVSVDGKNAMGEIVKPANGVVPVDIHVENAPWVVPTTVNVYVNGKVAVRAKALPDPEKGQHDLRVDVPVTADGFILVEVVGNESEFPSVYPHEIPPLQFTDVIGALGQSLGSLGQVKAFSPSLITVTTPYALTNPIWVDFDGDGVIKPGLALPDPAKSAGINAATHSDKQLQGPSVMKSVDVPWADTEEEAAEKAWAQVPLRKRIALARLPRWLWPSDRPEDVRRVLLQFVSHAD